MIPQAGYVWWNDNKLKYESHMVQNYTMLWKTMMLKYGTFVEYTITSGVPDQKSLNGQRQG